MTVEKFGSAKKDLICGKELKTNVFVMLFSYSRGTRFVTGFSA